MQLSSKRCPIEYDSYGSVNIRIAIAIVVRDYNQRSIDYCNDPIIALAELGKSLKLDGWHTLACYIGLIRLYCLHGVKLGDIYAHHKRLEGPKGRMQ